MMSLKEEILSAIQAMPGLTDTELEKRFNKTHQQINQCCRNMEQARLLVRRNNPEKDNHIGNYPTGIELPPQPVKKQVQAGESNALQEEDVKQILNDWLIANGWKTTVAWGKNHGVDIDAIRNNERWLIEVKGPGSRNEMRVNYFIGILGETLQRMDDEKARYSIAFPDVDQFRRLWQKLPELAKQRTTIDMILVKGNGDIEILK